MERIEKEKKRKRVDGNPFGGDNDSAMGEEDIDAPPRMGGLIDKLKQAQKNLKGPDLGTICTCGVEGCKVGPMIPRTLRQATSAGVVKWDQGCGCFG